MLTLGQTEGDHVQAAGNDAAHGSAFVLGCAADEDELFASNLHRHGKLLDFYVRPGASHYTPPQPGVLKRILDAYL